MTVLVESGPDAGVAWHAGDPLREQRRLERGEGAVDLSHRGIVAVSGPDRLAWLHSLTTQHLTGLTAGAATTALILSPQGHVEHVLYGVDDGETFWAHTEPGAVTGLAAWLDRMRFMMRVEVRDRTDAFALVWRPGGPSADDSALTRSGPDSLGGHEAFVPRDRLDAVLDAAGPRAGLWAYEALRIAAGVPRIGLDTDHRTIPNEIAVPSGDGRLGTAVHLDKGCYRGQETVARVHTLGRPPRRLVRLLLDGSAEALPAVGSPLTLDGRTVGRVGGSARHHELGPIALALVKRNVPEQATVLADGIAAAQEVLVDPDVGLHVRPRLG